MAIYQITQNLMAYSNHNHVYSSQIYNLSMAQQGQPISDPWDIGLGDSTKGWNIHFQNGSLTWLVSIGCCLGAQLQL